MGGEERNSTGSLDGLLERWADEALHGARVPSESAPACVAMVRTTVLNVCLTRVQWQAVRLLGKIGAPPAVPAVPDLTWMLEGSRGWILPALAALAFGGIGTPEAREALERTIRELAPGSARWKKQENAEPVLIVEAARAGLGLGPVPDMPVGK